MAEVGRPTIMDELTLKKLDECFANGATDIQACFIANISTQTLYNYQHEHPEYVERKQALKDMIAYQAKLKIKHDLETELGSKTAQWYLERKDKDFKQKKDITSNDETLNPVLVKFLNEPNDNNNTTGIQTTV